MGKKDELKKIEKALEKAQKKADKALKKAAKAAAKVARKLEDAGREWAVEADLAHPVGEPHQAEPTGAEPRVAKAHPRSPFAPAEFPTLPTIEGADFAAVAAGVRYAGRLDVMLARLAPGSVIAGALTRSATCSAAVEDCRAKLAKTVDGGAAILVNSGNANAFTGEVGQHAVQTLCEAVAERVGISKDRVFTASTGVIGEPLPYERILARLDAAVGELSPHGLPDCARAIMTTDTYPKGSAATIALDGQTIHIAGIAKGSGMIAPNMATMLAFIFTDATIDQAMLQAMVLRQCDESFNCITVDGDTSTSDTVLVAATGRSARIKPGAQAAAFESALGRVMRDLAQQIVKDGEGAHKFVTVRVTGAANDADARKVALTIANSPLVKTALAGDDPNWGRIVAVVGHSGARIERDKLALRFGEISVAQNGAVDPTYREEAGAAYMRKAEIEIAVDLGLGKGQATIWTCDLTERYVAINADYRS